MWQIKQGSNQFGWNSMVSKYKLALDNMIEYHNLINKTDDPNLKTIYKAELDKYAKEKEECNNWLERWRIEWD